MGVKNYNWTRFWVPRDGDLVLERGGYLQDPQSQYGNLLNPGALAFSAIESHPCLVLLGEPGIGKSRALQEALAGIEPFSPMSGDQVLFRNLNLYTTDSFLVQNVFEGQEFLKWQNGSGTLYLVLDSLDECLLRVDTVANILAQKLRDLPADRVKLRISCRTAMWPKSLEDACTNLWGEEKVGVYELAPLRMIDVESAASSEGLDAENFLMEAESRNAVALAAKPITLTFLLTTFKRHGGFPWGAPDERRPSKLNV